MSKELKLWDVPDLAPSFREFQGRSIEKLIKEVPHVITWHVRNHNMVISEAAKAEMKQRQKKRKTVFK